MLHSVSPQARSGAQGGEANRHGEGMSLLIIVQARHNSSRLPLKISADIEGLSMVARVVERVSKLGAFTVAYPKPECEDENDVLSRFARVARQNPDKDTFVRITADTPLLDIGVAAFVINLYRDRQNDLDFVGTAPEMDGTDVEVFSRTALRMADLNAKGKAREHVTPWMRKNLGAMIVNLAPEPLRWSVDTQEDLDFVRGVYRACGLCAAAVPHHTNAGGSIGGTNRTLVVDLHQVEDGGLAECTAADLKRSRMGGEPYVSA